MTVKIYPELEQIETLASIYDVAVILSSLNRSLQHTSLSALQNFNAAYLVITQNVRRELEQGNFHDSDFLNQFDVQFAKYYLRALKQYVQGQVTPSAWRQAFDACTQATISPLIAMTLGINAHINNDIPQVLRDCQASQYHKADYHLVNAIISDSIYEVIETLQTDTSWLSPKRNWLKPLYKAVARLVIRHWRGNAWNDFMRLSAATLSLARLEQKANKRSQRLSLLPV